MLEQSGSRHVTEETLRADLAAGAPVNQDATINVVALAAWLVREMQM